ncbi:MAG: lipoate protein ligase C-terminal domain-containing protein [Actinomycetota bacterium]
MRGEHKTAGGKLVAVDFEVRNGRLADVTVSGDFFLEPPEALGEIAAALEGAPADAGDEALAARVREALGPGVEMVGFSPEAVARAVGKGLA